MGDVVDFPVQSRAVFGPPKEGERVPVPIDDATLVWRCRCGGIEYNLGTRGPFCVSCGLYAVGWMNS